MECINFVGMPTIWKELVGHCYEFHTTEPLNDLFGGCPVPIDLQPRAVFDSPGGDGGWQVGIVTRMNLQSFASWLSNAKCKCEEAVVTTQ